MIFTSLYTYFILYTCLLTPRKNKAVKYSHFLAFLDSTEVGSIMAAEFIWDPRTLFLEAFLYLPNCLAIRADKGNPVGRFIHRKKV